MTATTSTTPSASKSSPCPALAYQEHPTVSPKLQQLFSSPKSGGSYGCLREVFHPLSPLAEPSAVLFYDSDDDEDDESVSGGSTSEKSEKSPKNRTSSAITNLSPLANRNKGPSTPQPSDAVYESTDATIPEASQARGSPRKLGSTQTCSLIFSKKRSSQPNVSDLFGIDSTELHIVQDDLPPKRSRKSSQLQRKLDYGISPIQSDDEGHTSGSGPEDVEEAIPELSEGSSPKDPTTHKDSVTVSPRGNIPAPVKPLTPRASPKAKLQESPSIESQSSSRSLAKSPAHITPGRRNIQRLPTTSPRRFPLPESPVNESSSSSVASSPGYLPQLSPIANLSSSMNRRDNSGRNRASVHADTLADRLQILHIKAQEYSESITRPASDRQLARELDALFSKENRFDPKEAAVLEERFQTKIRAAYEKKLAEDRHRAEIHRLEQERLRAIAAVQRAAEEKKRREAEEREEARRQKEQAELEKRRKAEEEAAAAAAKALAEQKRLEEEKRLAEQQAKEKEVKAKAEASAAVPPAPDPQPTQSVQLTGPSVYGRKSFEVEAANVTRIITNLKELKSLNDAYLKESGLKQIRRELIPKFGQLNGMKDQTLAVREHIKNVMSQLITADGPKVSASNYIFTPPLEDFQVPVAFIWTANELAKMAVRQVVQECTSKPEAADPIGVVVAAVFADPKYLVGGKSFVDIFVARFLKRNPILMGEDGPDNTAADKIRLGMKEGEIEDAYVGRIQALTAGYAAIAGRDFGVSKLVNPYPTFNLWFLLASLLNKSPEKLTNAHYFVMNTILQLGTKKLLGIYGVQAKKLVELAIGPWAARGMEKEIGGAHAVQSTGLWLKGQAWYN